MQPSPTSSLLAGASPRLRVFTLSLHVGILATLLALGACRDPKVSAYRVPKESASELPASKPIHGGAAASAEAPSAMPAVSAPGNAGMAAQPAAGTAPDSHGLQTAAGQSLSWSAPAQWQSKPASMMRKATYVIAGDQGSAELAVTAFPGDVGGDVANVNRWRGQVGLPPVSDADAAAAIERFEVNGLKIGVVDVVDHSAANATHLIGAIVPYDGATWFFKLLGPDAVVAAQKPAFIEFLKTVKPAAAATP